MIYVGAGHGGVGAGGMDRGAFGHGESEWDVCTAVLHALLEKHKDRLRLVPQRLQLKNRIAWLEKHLAPDDVYVELHMNAATPTATGAEIFSKRGDNRKMTIARGMINRYCEKTELRNRGAKPDTATQHGRLGVIMDVRCESYLIELGFITNKGDLDIVKKKAVFGLEAALKLPSTDIKDWVPSIWAKPAWDKAKKKGIISDQTNPYEEITSATMQWIFFNGGAFTEKPIKDTLQVQRFIVALDRTGWLDTLPDKN